MDNLAFPKIRNTTSWFEAVGHKAVDTNTTATFDLFGSDIKVWYANHDEGRVESWQDPPLTVDYLKL